MNRIEKKWDIALWGIVYMLPIIILIVTNINFMGDKTTEIITLETIMEKFPYLGNLSSIMVYILRLTGEEINNTAIFEYLAYIMTMVLTHLMVDTLLFIPRFMNHLMDKQI